MQIYFSGCGRTELEADPRLGSPRYRLFSCHGNYVNYGLKTAEVGLGVGGEYSLMLDSGAFTAWQAGKKFTVDQVINAYKLFVDKFAHRLEDIWLINLDVIPGRRGAVPTQDEIDQALVESDENYKELVKAFGNIVLPVFHMTESKSRLKEVVDMSAGYVLISPRNDWSERERIPWAKQTHKDLPDGIRTHGLGATGLSMMREVPWHSVDSTSWLMTAMYGNIWIPGSYKVMGMSSDNPALKNKPGGHYQHLTEREREPIDKYAEEHGFTVEELSADYGARSIWNRMVSSDVYRAIPEGGKATPEQDTLFGVY